MDIFNRAKGKLHKIAFSAAGIVGFCETENTIVLAGSPRSGTTLLLEVLSTLPGYKAINEPLIRRRTQLKHGFTYRTYLPDGKFTTQQYDFLNNALQGQIGSSARWLFKSESHPGRLIEHAATNKLVVKFCRINRMLPQFAKRFEVRGIVFIVRHPCAVINSMLHFGQWDRWNLERIKNSQSDPTSPIYIQHLPDDVLDVFAPVLNRIQTQTEALAMSWCLDHFFPLIYSNHHPWILVSYEKLIKNNKQELERVTDALGMQLNEDMLTKVNKPSKSVKGLLYHETDVQISKWKHQLTSQQIDDILSIVDETGLSKYFSDSIEPNYELLSPLQKTDKYLLTDV